MTLALVAVFVPILLMGGIDGRLFREFAVTLSVAIMISLIVSLTTTPMMCAYLLAQPRASAPLQRRSTSMTGRCDGHCGGRGRCCSACWRQCGWPFISSSTFQRVSAGAG